MSYKTRVDNFQGRTCKRHGKALEKHKSFDGRTIWTCPREKCSYKENEEGEKV